MKFHKKTSRSFFSIKALTVSLFLTMVLFMAMGWQIWDEYIDFMENRSRDIRIHDLSGIIIHYDEVLTMSARMAAVTGDIKWSERYRRFEPQLYEALKEAMVLVPDEAMKDSVTITDKANRELVDKEKRALKLVSTGDLTGAQEILFSDDYESQKRLYKNGIDRVSEGLTLRFDEIEREHIKQGFFGAMAVAIALPVLFLIWIITLRVFRRHIAERDLAEAELRKFKDRLEVEVLKKSQRLMDAQKEITRSEKLAILGKMAGMVGHEIRTPLGVIKNVAHLLEKKNTEENDAEAARYLQILNNEVQVADRIIDDILTFGRIKTPQLVKARMDGIIKDAIEKLNISEEIKVTVDLKDMPEALVDRDQIMRVFTNIIFNAVQAMPGGGKLGIKGAAKDGGIEISVIDSGTGIPEDIIDKIFDPLFTTKTHGTGLGLSVCQGIVDAHNGTIGVESGAVQGTKFIVKLPV